MKSNKISCFVSWIVVLTFLGGVALGEHDYNGPYTGTNLNRVAFPIGGIGAGMICLEGTEC
ncbi:MAG: hypothetical protein JW860_13370 [Sedimentisphaerales bacterium]|nr:hypothetical protein [Sedimentisphaerales bacterium]